MDASDSLRGVERFLDDTVRRLLPPLNTPLVIKVATEAFPILSIALYPSEQGFAIKYLYGMLAWNTVFLLFQEVCHLIESFWKGGAGKKVADHSRLILIA